MGSKEIAMGKKMDKEAAVENFKHTPFSCGGSTNLSVWHVG